MWSAKGGQRSCSPAVPVGLGGHPLQVCPCLGLQLRASLPSPGGLAPVHGRPLFADRSPGSRGAVEQERQAGRAQAQVQRVSRDGDHIAVTGALAAGAVVGGRFWLHGIILWRLGLCLDLRIHHLQELSTFRFVIGGSPLCHIHASNCGGIGKETYLLSQGVLETDRP